MELEHSAQTRGQTLRGRGGIREDSLEAVEPETQGQMTADLEEAGGVGEAEQGLCHSLDPPRTIASVRKLGALSQEEPELRMQAGPTFRFWSLSIKKKRMANILRKSQHTHRSREVSTTVTCSHHQLRHAHLSTSGHSARSPRHRT